MHQTTDYASNWTSSNVTNTVTNNATKNATNNNQTSNWDSWNNAWTPAPGIEAGNFKTQPEHYNPNVDVPFECARQRLLSRLISLSTALEHKHWDTSETLLHQFCETLLKYLTLGHERAFTKRLPNTHLYSAIASTTRCSLAFYDRYYRGTGSLNTVRSALEQLALTLETRFELEDDLNAQALAA